MNGRNFLRPELLLVILALLCAAALPALVGNVFLAGGRGFDGTSGQSMQYRIPAQYLAVQQMGVCKTSSCDLIFIIPTSYNARIRQVPEDVLKVLL